MPEHHDRSNPEFTPILPTILAPEPDGSSRSRAPDRQWFKRVVIGLSLTALLAALVGVVFVLPRFVSQPVAPGTAPESAPAPAVAAPDADATPAAPTLPEPETTRERREAAQARLAAILRSTAALESKQVRRWAESEYRELSASIDTGEKAYREQRHDDALAAYDAALRGLEALEGRVPEVLALAVDDGYRALTRGDSLAATEAFDFALAIEPGHRDASKGLARAKTLDRVLALIAEGRGYERLDDLGQALAAYERALALDAEAPDAVAGAARVRQAKTDQRYRAAMSEGFAAFKLDRLSEATDAFERAIEIKPNAEEAAAALRQSRNLATSRRIEATLADAERLARQERWTEAADKYRAALSLDDKLPAAVDGNARANTRAQLDQQLGRAVEEPLRLSDDAVFREASALYEQAASVADPGPRLAEQLRTLAQQLKDARTPIKVTLRSDQRTQVTLYKVGKLGAFEQRQVALHPGRYTVVGTREGYRDVRVEFTVMPNQPAPSVLVQCEERIAFGN